MGSDFMHGFPFLVRRDLFALARARILESVLGGLKEPFSREVHRPEEGEVGSFAAAFAFLDAFTGRVHDEFIIAAEQTPGLKEKLQVSPLLSAPQVLGHAAFLFDRNRYEFSI